MLPKIYRKLISSPLLCGCFVFLLYFAVAGIANWSLAIGHNSMVGDIYRAHYPASVYLSECIKSGTLPVWNPLMRFGTPYYAIVGMPVWYPSTMILAAVGYHPWMMGFEYILHIAIAGFGMYLLTMQFISSKDAPVNPRTFGISFLAGLLYCFSTVFISNGQHIMIIISAAWLPYILYYFRRYLEEKKLSALLLTGFFAGMNFLGGYPELMVATFITLIFYTLYYNYKQGRGILKNILSSVWKYCCLGLCTVLSAMITVLPFLLCMSNVSRITGGTGVHAYSPSLTSTLTFFLPSYDFSASSFQLAALEEIDPSMISLYMGLLACLALPCILTAKIKGKAFHYFMIAFAFFMCLGNKSFIHSLFYRFFPMFKSFRFPTMWRCIIAVFLLLLCAGVLYQIICRRDKKLLASMVKTNQIFVLVYFALGTLFSLSLVFLSDEDLVKNINYMIQAFFLSAVLLSLFLLVFLSFQRKDKPLRHRNKAVLLCAVVIVDLLTWQNLVATVPYMRIKQTGAIYDAASAQAIQQVKEEFRARNSSVDITSLKRSRSGELSQQVIFHKTYDSEGYLSFYLQGPQDYIQTQNYQITQQNPVIYFTDNVVTANEVRYEEWVQSPSASPNQIYLENGKAMSGNTAVSDSANLLNQTDLTPKEKNGTYRFDHDFSPAPTTGNAKLLLYLDGASDRVSVKAKYYRFSEKLLKENKEIEQSTIENTAEYITDSNENGTYIELYFPDSEGFARIDLTLPEGVSVTRGDYRYEENLDASNHVTVNSFTPNTIKVTADAPNEGYLTVLQSSYPGWKAYVDGKEVALEKVNQVFMGIHLGQGKHEIELRFRPWDFYIGLCVSALYLIFMTAVLIRQRLRRKKAPAARVKQLKSGKEGSKQNES